MDKKQPGLIIAGMLVVIFAFVLGGSLKKTRPKSPSPRAESVAQAPISSRQDRTPPAKIGSAKDDLSEERLRWGRDPFVLYDLGEEASDTPSSLKLMGITATKNTMPRAIINDSIVSVGSKVGKFKVLEISPSKVVVTDGEKNYELEMKL